MLLQRHINKLFSITAMQIAVVFVLLSVCQVNAQNADGAPINVRFADHPTFSRIVFDWEKVTPYGVELRENELVISFEQTAAFDFGLLQSVPLRFFGNPRTVKTENGIEVHLDVREPSRMKHFRDGTKVAVDLMELVSAEVARAQARKKETLDQKAAKIDKAARVFAGDVAQENTPNKVAANELRPLSVNLQSSRDSLALNYTHKGRAAAFIRGDTLWIVFDEKLSIDQATLDQIDTPIVREARHIPHERATILTHYISPGHYVTAAKKDSGWHFDVKATLAVPRIPVPVGLQRGSGQGDQLFLSAEDVGPVIEVTDPVVGDKLRIVPLGGSSHGVVQTRRYSQFIVLETAQGVALQTLADDMTVTQYDNGIGLASAGELALSKGKLPILFAPSQKADQKDFTPVRLIDFDTWKRGPLPDGDFTENKQELLYRLAMSTEDKRNEARWDLARFYLGNGFAADALGPLTLMIEDDEDLDDSPEYRAVRAIAEISMRQYKSALILLNHESLNAELDAYLWRSLASEALGLNAQAVQAYKRGVDILSLYPIRHRAHFQLSAVRAAFAEDDLQFMKEELAVLEQMPLPSDQYAQVEYWQARLYQKENDWERASEVLEKVVDAGVRQISAQAKYTLINEKHGRNELSTIDAIDQLERLRFAWRGDDFELDLLYRLGELYIQEQEFRTGFDTLRQAATYFTKSPKTRNITKLMSDIYRDLFLNGQADILPPVKAMALYYDFRELTPLGADGDKMIRRLADRLVSVDLLDRAAGLLEHQVKHRLKGVAQADIASRLAMIYILDSKPDMALSVLMGTRQQKIPKDVEHRRDLIEARALIELGRYEEAEIMLQRKEGRDVDLLRADIFWGAENWPAVVRNAEQLLAGRDRNSEALNNDERRTIMRQAVAMALDENSPGLRQLRRRYWPLMQGGVYANAFDLITSKPEDGPQNVRVLAESIASVDKLEGFMESYKNQFSIN